MSSFLVLGIYLLLLSGDGEETRWNCFLYGGYVENDNDKYGVNNFSGMTTWRLFFLSSDIKVKMLLLP
jgi:hypothetical protein